MKTPLPQLLTVLLAVLLGGCMPDLKSDLPPDRIYWLEVPEIGAPPAVDLRVSVVPGLNSDRIWLLQKDQRINYYAGAYWPDNLQPLLESLLVRSLGAPRSGSEMAVMAVMVERFFAVEAGIGVPPDVVVRALLESGDASCRFEDIASLEGDRLRDVVAGHQKVLEGLTSAISGFARTGRCP